ncbi:MAG: nuclear transport factor 2 family protein, partial [Phycisphaerales bacterium]|nr:nuclear transport factor 2 family protein [Phycisphaerales bacterium]
MRSGLRWMGALGGLALLGGCAASGHHAMPDVYDAHEDYVTAINANDVDAVMAMLTDDVVFMAPHEPRLVGKAAVRPWAEGYLAAYTIHWTKTTLEFVVSGDWAFEQYAYESADVPRDGGA